MLALSGIDYNDFTLRGLEFNDSTSFVGSDTAISWYATSPGDWTRLITAYSPGGDNTSTVSVPEPSSIALMAAGIASIGFARKK
jgi:hypothetical protein